MKTLKYKSLPGEEQELISRAEQVMKNAYDPSSGFRVGSALLTNKGNIYAGCNINMCSYTGICAERAAISNAVSNGEYDFTKIAVICKGDTFDVKDLSGPCGICRQMIWEFSEYAKCDIKILMSDTTKDNVLISTASEMHPAGFGPRSCYAI